MNPTGYPSNEDDTLVDHGFAGCPDRDPQPDPSPSAYTNGVVTPHAAFLALRYAPEAAMADLQKLAHDFSGLYTPWGFRDSVNVDTGVVSCSYLSLDQGIIMAAIGNALGHDFLRDAFSDREWSARCVRSSASSGSAPASTRRSTSSATPARTEPGSPARFRRAPVIRRLAVESRVRRLLSRRRDFVGELGEPLAFDVADRNELLPDAAHVVDQPPALAPDRLGAACQIAAARLGRLEQLLGLGSHRCAQILGVALG